uniref:Spermidine synthase n=1 Tax=Dolomedes mizhoanus TaxID=1366394 RepID=S5N3X7_9ARAC|nr:spermidine synthase [Dolomedes mizhoanus]
MPPPPRPLFRGGQCGFLLCGMSAETNFREPLQKLTSQSLKDFGFRYYTPDVHRAAFVHPPHISKELGLKEEVDLY